MEKRSESADDPKEIKILSEDVEKIYEIIESNVSPYPSIDEFIKSAVEMKLKELDGSILGR